MIYTIIYYIYSIFVCIIVLSACLFAVFTCYIAYIRWIYRHIPGPPVTNFWLGNINDLRECKKSEVIMHDLLLKWHYEYGNIFRVFILHKCMIVPCEKSLYKKILTDSKIYPKNRRLYTGLRKVVGERFLGNGLATNVNHSEWSKRRNCLNPFFKKNSLYTRVGKINAVVSYWLHRLRDGGDTCDMSTWLSNVCLDIIGQVGFGMKFRDSKVHEDIAMILEIMSRQARDPLFMLGFGEYRLRKRTREAIVRLRTSFKDRIITRCNEMSESSCDDVFCSDILDHLILSTENNKCLDIEDILDDFTTIIIAGHETSAHALTFALVEVLRNPEVLNRLQREIHSVTHERNGNLIDETFLGRLTYMEDVLQEVLRLYPVVSATSRENSTAVMLESMHIPKGSLSNFDGPTEFDPDHMNNKSPFAFMPFSLGQRACIGRHFTMIEMKIILSNLLMTFDMELYPTLSKHARIHILDRSTLSPLNDVFVKLTKRD